MISQITINSSNFKAYMMSDVFQTEVTKKEEKEEEEE